MSGARPAASVILLRDSPRGVEAWLMQRVDGMAFAGGMTVFPGGRVDPADAEVDFAGDAEAMAARFGEPTDEVRAALVAGARELFEETGVLLTDVSPLEAGQARGRLEARETTFADVLAASGATLDARALHGWARWVTPESEPRRYDTYFFVAALPDGAVADAVTAEAAHGHWVPVRAAITQAHAGERLLLPPTMANLADIAPFDTVAGVLAAAAHRDLGAVLPVIEKGADGLLARLPDGSSWAIPRLAG